MPTSLTKLREGRVDRLIRLMLVANAAAAAAARCVYLSHETTRTQLMMAVDDHQVNQSPLQLFHNSKLYGTLEVLQ